MSHSHQWNNMHQRPCNKKSGREGSPGRGIQTASKYVYVCVIILKGEIFYCSYFNAGRTTSKNTLQGKWQKGFETDHVYACLKL